MASRRIGGELVRVVLTGSPNSGKSSLFNALVGGAGALVSDQPGTTRDYLAAEIDLDDAALYPGRHGGNGGHRRFREAAASRGRAAAD